MYMHIFEKFFRESPKGLGYPTTARVTFAIALVQISLVRPLGLAPTRVGLGRVANALQK
jgi:hypothetical protein